MKLPRHLSMILFFLSSTAFATDPLVLTGSSDATQWIQSPPSSIFSDADTLTMMTPFKNGIAAIENTGNGQDVIFSSDEGTSWSLLSSELSSSSSYFSGLAGYKTGLGATLNWNSGQNGQVTFSTDGVLWYSGYTYGVCDQILKSSGISTSDSNFMAMVSCWYGDKGLERPTVLMSPDGKKWSQTSANLPSDMESGQATFNKSYWDGKQWFILATKADNTPVLYTTPDTKNWTRIPLSSEIQSLTSIAINGNEWMLTGTYFDAFNSPIILRSIDKGNSWIIEKTFPVKLTHLNKIAKNDSGWVAVGSGGENKKSYPVILLSKDGVNWQNASLPDIVLGEAANAMLNDVMWDGKKWIAIGSYRAKPTGCMALNDMKNWMGILSGTNNHLNVSNLSLWVTTEKNKTSGSYSISGSIEYSDDPGGQFGFSPFSGICNEHDDGSIDWSMNMDNYRISGARRNITDPQLVISNSSLIDSSGSAHNYTGTLVPIPGK